MNTLIGDIGNTIIKICLVEIRTLKIKKISFLNSNKITSKKFPLTNFNIRRNDPQDILRLF